MSIYCDRGQHHRCSKCDCACHPPKKKKEEVKDEPVDVPDESQDPS